MRFMYIFIAFFYSNRAIACFIQPEGLAQQHEATFLQMLALSAVFCALALIMRFLSGSKRLWVPMLWFLGVGYVPVTMYILVMEGIAGSGGVCGRVMLLDIGQTLTISFAFILAYEIYRYCKIKYYNTV